MMENAHTFEPTGLAYLSVPARHLPSPLKKTTNQQIGYVFSNNQKPDNYSQPDSPVQHKKKSLNTKSAPFLRITKLAPPQRGATL
jgi:hypothetical protein